MRASATIYQGGNIAVYLFEPTSDVSRTSPLLPVHLGRSARARGIPTRGGLSRFRQRDGLRLCALGRDLEREAAGRA